MKRFGIFTLTNGDFKEDLEITGIGKISGNLKAYSIKSFGLIVGGTLESTNGSIISTAKKNNFLEVKKDLKSAEEILVNGKCSVGGKIQTKHLKIIGSLKAGAISANTVEIAGKIEIDEEIRATNAITIEINFTTKINVKGEIIAPVVTLKFRPRYKKIVNVPRNVFRSFGLLKLIDKEFIIDNIRIKANTLILDSLYPINNAKFIFSDTCRIDVQKVEKIQGV